VALFATSELSQFSFFFFFFEKIILKNKEDLFFLKYKLLICYVEQIKHGVDRSLRPGQPKVKKKKKLNLCPE
jgi:hypothetical protein